MLGKIEELQLIARCAAFDDHRAFARLVDEYSPGLRRFIFNQTLGDAALTDDIAQETFIKAYISIRSFKGMARFSTWIYTIACRLLADHRRRIHEEHPARLPDQPATDTPSGFTEELRHDINVALGELSEKERTAILLFYLQDRPIKEIVRIMEIPEGSVKALLSRARTKMAKTINDYDR